MDKLHTLALTQIPGIGCVTANKLITHCGSAENVFKASVYELSKIHGLGEKLISSIKSFTNFSAVQDQLSKHIDNGCRVITYNESDYPQALLTTYDFPLVLFLKGEIDLNYPKQVSVIGTRNYSDYGKEVTAKLITELSTYKPLIISGLAIGIDTFAHINAIKNNLPTLAVMGTGLGTVYPATNKNLADEIVKNGGGLLTENLWETKPDVMRFPQRNRIIAGLCEALIVVEATNKGGALITADLANDYEKEIYAVPGNIFKSQSEGCHYLISSHKAHIYTSVETIAENLNWNSKNKQNGIQKSIFEFQTTVSLTPDQKLIVDQLSFEKGIDYDDLLLQTGLSSSVFACELLNLELDGIINLLPGKKIKRRK